MSKIGILTYHSGFNYGACLQAYALQTTLKKKFGYDSEIINFETDALCLVEKCLVARQGV